MNILQMVKAYGSLIFGKQDYWHPDMLVNKNCSLNKIDQYYVDTKSKHNYIGKMDENNIPLLEMDGTYYYFPVTIAQYALGNFDKYIETKDRKYFDVVIICAEWFVTNIQETSKGVYGYVNDYDKMTYGLHKPWLSSLSQGQPMSVLARCYSVTKDKRYLDVCEKLLKSFEVKSQDKGVLALLNSGYFYEEYPSKEPSFVLNGLIFSLWGLLDFNIVSDNKKAIELYNKGEKTLYDNLMLFNIKGIKWSRYDLYNFKIHNIASVFYHKLHIEQLKSMYILTNKDVYREYYTAWEKSKNNIFVYIIATLYKIVHKLSVRNQSNYVPSISDK
ncbi:D-glucuronyl C5-epimerase family protein [Clostridium estertheticum]|uniref:D-glucuronyl C5-epimerase family protein n=1 Tax=Clostridium estertheticum TaxID=238834 RepID=UPI0013E95DE6|nr:D-glucuronyl C5-epimerase family protein [Clostridium estertheticum]MBZ9687623.1 D-glucuronyl C5-epimerase family protein [Clostridium estertheticum]